jgi:hypothetical protein
VEYQHGATGPVLHVVDHHLAHSDLHPSKLPAQEASRRRGLDRGSRCRPALEWAPVILSTAGHFISPVRVLDDSLAKASIVLGLFGRGACQPRPDRAMTLVMLIRTAVKPACTNDSAKSSAGWEG